jgi:tetratricopeptide (TPR) repeat protein
VRRPLVTLLLLPLLASLPGVLRAQPRATRARPPATAAPASSGPASSGPASSGPAAPAPVEDELARARVLDKEGAKAYAEGHYHDAIRYFEEAYRLGGPSFELWNIARCHLRLDQPDRASELLERYLATPQLPPEDRDEAAQQLEALRRLPSTLTVASLPAGATLTVDGRAPAEGKKTPMSLPVAAGTHVVVLTHPAYATYTRTVEARYGRAIILDAQMRREGSASPERERARAADADADAPRVALRAEAGVMLPRYGSVGGSAQPALVASGMVRIADLGATRVSGGVMAQLTFDAWDNTVGAADAVAPCGTLSHPRSATALSAFAAGDAGWQLGERLRARAVAGLGLAAYAAGDLGGDVFVPACRPSPGVRPSVLLGGQLDYAVTGRVRLSATPLLFEVQPAFAGARTAPLDASGAWLRAIIAVGVGVDL